VVCSNNFICRLASSINEEHSAFAASSRCRSATRQSSLSLRGSAKNIEPILLARILFDQGIRQQQAVRKHRHPAGIEMRGLARPDLKELGRKDVMVQDYAAMAGDLNAIAHRLDFPPHP